MGRGNAGSFILLLVKIPRRADVLVEAGPFGAKVPPGVWRGIFVCFLGMRRGCGGGYAR